MESSFPEFLAKKAYEISYAVFRVSGGAGSQAMPTGRQANHTEFYASLEAGAVRLLEMAVRDDTASAAKEIMVLEYLLRLGGDSGVLNPNHVDLIINELSTLESAIAGHETDLQSEIQSAIGNQSEIIGNQSEIQSEKAREISDYAPESEIQSEIESEVIVDGEALSETINERQETILEFIRKSNGLPGRQIGCRLKDIFDGLEGKLQGVGDRTIRNDLQELIERGVVEKCGPGGAYTYYRPRA